MKNPFAASICPYAQTFVRDCDCTTQHMAVVAFGSIGNGGIGFVGCWPHRPDWHEQQLGLLPGTIMRCHKAHSMVQHGHMDGTAAGPRPHRTLTLQAHINTRIQHNPAYTPTGPPHLTSHDSQYTFTRGSVQGNVYSVYSGSGAGSGEGRADPASSLCGCRHRKECCVLARRIDRTSSCFGCRHAQATIRSSAEGERRASCHRRPIAAGGAAGGTGGVACSERTAEAFM